MATSYWTSFTPIRNRVLQYAIGNLPGKKTVTYRLQRYADGIRVYRGTKKVGTEQGWQAAQDLVREDYRHMLRGTRTNPPRRTRKARRAVVGKTKVSGRYSPINKTIKTSTTELFIYRRGATVGIIEGTTGGMRAKHRYQTEAAAKGAYKKITSLASAMRFIRRYGR